ncbi:MAG: 3-hydroxyacyl-CoA dehydrogenase NAD-binding domain-containing protein, partial [Betaproteobacteria bacterium]
MQRGHVGGNAVASATADALCSTVPFARLKAARRVQNRGMNTNLFRDRPVAVIGAGVMGVGIVQVALLAGHPVRLFD